jgi:hypothetical protein
LAVGEHGMFIEYRSTCRYFIRFVVASVVA